VNRVEHYREAERLTVDALDGTLLLTPDVRARLLSAAQIHASLAAVSLGADAGPTRSPQAVTPSLATMVPLASVTEPMTVTECARQYGISTVAVRNRIAEGLLPAAKHSRIYVIDRKDAARVLGAQPDRRYKYEMPVRPGTSAQGGAQ
jgi:hypothetical protein